MRSPSIQNIVSIVNATPSFSHEFMVSHYHPCQGYVDNNIPDHLPVKFQEAAMIFEPNTRFSLTDDNAWAAMLATNEGFVRLGPNGLPFATALYHQLHCMNGIRFSHTIARDGLVTNEEILKAKLGHMNHCFQFLRQSIMCKADTTLIPLNGSIALSGFDRQPHRCRDWTQIRQYVENNVAEWKGRPFLEGDVMMDE